MSNTHRILLLLAFAFSMSALFGQRTYTLHGVVLDSASHSRVAFVNVGLFTADSTRTMAGAAVTDQNGRFTIADAPAGDYLLKLSLIGYDVRTVPVTVGGEEAHVRLRPVALKKGNTTLGEVSIVTERPVFMVEGEKTMYNVSDDPTIQSGTASDALQNTPGVEVDIEGNITLHGASSVEIWMNDKPSNLTEDNLKNFIRQLPANALERIEVINNPSAKYNTEADAIINIVLAGNIKKNSFISFGVTGSSRPEVNPWVSYVWANEKLSLNFYLSGRYNFQNSISESYATRFNHEGDTSSNGHGSGQSITHNFSTSFSFNGSYTFDTLNTMSFWAGTYPSWSRYSNDQNVFRREYLEPSAGLYAYITDAANRSFSAGAYGGMWFLHRFDRQGHELKANMSGNFNRSQSFSEEIRDYMLQDFMDYHKKKTNNGLNYSVRASLDYSRPFARNHELSVGMEGSYRQNSGLSSSDTLVMNTADVFLLDSLRLKDTRTQNGGVSVFATLQHKFGNFTVKEGLRIRYNHEVYQIFNSPKDNVIQNKLSYFPSLHLSYRTKSMHNFRLSYTYRIKHPDASRLSPFISYGEDSYSMGNPELDATQTHNVEFNWTKFVKKFGNLGLSAYFKHTGQKVNTLTDVAYSDIFGRVVTFTMPVNAGTTLNTGASFNMNYRLKTFMSIRFYANIYYEHSEYRFRNEPDPRIFSHVGYSFRLNYWAKLWKVLEVFASANYRSKSVSLFTTTRPRYSIDCGLRADLLQRKISLHLNVSDIFNWNRSATAEDNPYYVVRSSTKYNSRFISAGITLRFGKMELEKKAQNSGPSEIEESDE
ncbi:MAG: outer membrane beta-barrel protein [Bacteroidales bacterium]|nr:outer membrane beta-barrel protein [Bacteroidales bacterium]MBR6161239.1 outer membrane beta-barrel protein [Bacteroidales bacterium]